MKPELIYGIHAVGRRLRQSAEDCNELLCLEAPNARLRQLIGAARAAGVEVTHASRAELEQRCGSDKHQGCVLIARGARRPTDFDECLRALHPEALLLVLDGIQDPHNLGACLRSADACGVDAVVIPKDNSAKLNATVRKVAAGAAETVPLVEVTNLARALERLKQAGAWIYGASEHADSSIYDHDYRGPVALVMGAEGAGLRRLTRESCDHLVSLPMRGQVESLNVSVATGICLYEIRRARAAGK